MTTSINIVGIGPGDAGYILPLAKEKIESSDVLIGGKRNLELFSHLDKKEVIVGNNLDYICRFIVEHGANRTITVLASGDPGIYSITEYIKSQIPGIELFVVPGISSFQYLCGKLGISWHDIRIASLHGRREDIFDIIRKNNKVVIFTGGTVRPQNICESMIEEGILDVSITVGENLSYKNERIVTGTLQKISEMSFESLSIMLVQNEDTVDSKNKAWNYTTPGIPDSMFIRGDTPMTKEEVRAVTISKLKLSKSDTVYDIGAGTGSVSVECSFCCPFGKILSIEREEDAILLIKKNVNKFGLKNVTVVKGEAPSVLKGLPPPDRVFIGGSAGRMEELLEWVKSHERPVRVVINSVTVESVYEALKGMENKGFSNIDVINMSVSRGRLAGGKHLMQAMNPVFIISGEYGGSSK